MRLPLLTSILVVLASSTAAQSPGLYRTYQLAAGHASDGERCHFVSGEFTGDGLQDAVFLSRGLGGAGVDTPVGLYAAHLYNAPFFLDAPCRAAATYPRAYQDGTDAVFTVSGDRIQRWDWDETSNSFEIQVEFSSPAMTGFDLSAIAISSNEVNPWNYVVVSGEDAGGNARVFPMLFLNDDDFFSVMPDFAIPAAAHDLALADLDVDGLRDELAVLHLGGLWVYDVNGVHDPTLDVAGVPYDLVAPMQRPGGWEGFAYVTGMPGVQNLVLVSGEGLGSVIPLDWPVVGLAAGLVDGDDFPDLVLGTESGETRLLLHTGTSPEFVTPGESLHPAAGVRAFPTLLDHDNDGDVDVLTVAGDHVHVCLGKVEYEDGGKVYVIGAPPEPPPGHGGGGGGNDPGRGALEPPPAAGSPPAPGGEPVVILLDQPGTWDPDVVDSFFWVARRQASFMPGGALEDYYGFPPGGPEPAPTTWPHEVPLTLVDSEIGGESTVFYIEFWLIDDGPPRRVLPVRTIAYSASDDEVQAILAYCESLEGDKKCEPKDDIGVVVLPYVPPPSGPPPPASGG